MIVYLAGPMSGIKQFNIPAFEEATKVLRDHGHVVISPVELDGAADKAILMKSEAGHHDDLPREYSDYLKNDLITIRGTRDLEAIITLPGWDKSPGAKEEVKTAAKLGIPRYDYDPIFGFTIDGNGHEVYPVFESYEANPERQRQITGGVKDNASKSRVDLIPSKPLVGVGHVLAFGARKYKPNNWRLGLRWSDTLASAMRHMLAFADGEDLDPETGLPHIDQALCQLLFQSEYYHTKTGIDDRWSSLTPEERGEAKA